MPFKGPKDHSQYATPLHKLTFTELVKELWGPERLEEATRRLSPCLEARVLEHWMRRLVYAETWEEVFSESFLRVGYTTRIEEVVAGAIQQGPWPLPLGRRWALLLEGPRGLTLDQTAVILRCEAPWYADRRFPHRFAETFRAGGWILVTAVKWQRVIALSDLTFPTILKATLFNDRGEPVHRGRRLRSLL